jgi:alpha-glucosidase (family GH31 glycosyl hydrolase)
MSERDLALSKVKRAMEENTRQTKAMKLNAIMCDVNIKTYQKNIKHQEKLHKDIIDKYELQIKRAIENAEISHKKLDALLDEKEKLHLELKKASHYGMVLCEYCLKYFTSQGLSRHKSACSSKPEVKIVEKHEAEIKEDKEDIEARKAALKAELAKLDKK